MDGARVILLGEPVQESLNKELTQKADELLVEMNSPEWLLGNDRRCPDAKRVKIAEGIYVIQKMLKTHGGLIRVTAENPDAKLSDVHISGDFFFFPSSDLVELEQALEEVEAKTDAIIQSVCR